MDTLQFNQVASAGDTRAIEHMAQAIASGRHWYIALLEAIGLWARAEEVHQGRHYQYLIAGEAFDWLLLAERLCASVDGLLPEDEKLALLFQGTPPIRLTREKVEALIGGTKYHQYLNYFYGITVEEALVLAVQEEVRKEGRSLGYYVKQDSTDEVYRRIYGTTKAALLKRFRQKKGYRQLRSISLGELKEFTYWRFKYRLEHCDKAKIASDTKKALKYLNTCGLSADLTGSIRSTKS